MSASTLTFHSPRPVELGSINQADFDTLAATCHEIGTKYATPDLWHVSPDCIDYKIEPDGTVSVITNTEDDYDGSWSANKYTLQPTTGEESRLVVDALKPFTAAGQGWLHEDETVIAGFYRSLLTPGAEGAWHPDSSSAEENFKALLFYDSLPTQFAIGSLVLDPSHMAQPPTPYVMHQLLSHGRIRMGIEQKPAELVIVDGPPPLKAVGITHEHLHRARPVPASASGTFRNLLRLVTIRP
ncbi:MAG TPA: hypothetical protein VFB59_02825 [Candidatus Saccharimonadales bacterium]|nr:hypothetical protein [Candidatus Saccharimonadales bacterium]